MIGPPRASRTLVRGPTYRAISAESPTARILPSAMATAPARPRPVERPVQTGPPWITRSAVEPQAVSNASATTRDARRTRYLLTELGDCADGIDGRERIGSRIGRRLWLGGSAQAVADTEQHFEQQLFALIGRVEIGHTAIILCRLGSLVRFTVHRVQIVENLLAWPHDCQRYRFLA